MPFQAFFFFFFSWKTKKKKESGFALPELTSATFLIGDQSACLSVSHKFPIGSMCRVCAPKTDLVASASFTIKG